jgi:hypothetical protein
LSNRDQGVLGSGFSLVVRHQRILWWVFAVNLILGGLGASGTARALGSALHHSLAGEKLTSHVDLGMFVELVSQPSVKLFSHSGGVLLFAGLYFLFLIFITPGIISVYLEDRALTTGEFFGAAGTFFWMFVRLTLWSLIPFILVNLLYEGVQSAANYIGDRAVTDQTGFYILVIGCIPVLLLLVWVRLWFDLAQVRAVAMKEWKTRIDVARTFRLVLRRTWHVYWSYIVISIVTNVVTAVALLIWTKVPGRAVAVTFLLLEIIMLAHIFGHLWLKACATTWYRLNPESVAPVPGPITFDPIPQRYEQPRMLHVPDVDTPVTPEVESPPEDRQ